MSNTDSFIEEVSEEVRRDKLFRLFRRYGWIAGVLVVLLVGGAAYNEWSKARAEAAAQARGDAIMTAMEAADSAQRLAALSRINVDGDAQSIVALLTSAQAIGAADKAAAAAALDAIAADDGLPDTYRDLALLKRVIITSDDTAPDARIAALQPLVAGGGPFRILAEEQIALAELESGDRQAALTRLRALRDDTAATAGLRQRVTQLIVVLGGEAEPA